MDRANLSTVVPKDEPDLEKSVPPLRVDTAGVPLPFGHVYGCVSGI
jgi:hypothetical protein